MDADRWRPLTVAGAVAGVLARKTPRHTPRWCGRKLPRTRKVSPMGVAVIAAAIACIIGWHVSKVHMAHRIIPTRQRQLAQGRSERTHHLIRLAGFAFLLALIVIGALSLH